VTPEQPLEEDLATRCYRHPGRETLVRCSSCERPICTACMVAGPVGMRCPDCARGRAPSAAAEAGSGEARRPTPRTWSWPRAGGSGRSGLRMPGGGSTATTVLIAVNVLVFLAQLAQGASIGRGGGGGIIADGGVRAFEVADGEWWRLVTAGFIHAGIVHLLFNMFALWILGGMVEEAVGTPRMLLIYTAAVLWGSAGALLLSPNAITVGASGGVFGLMGALLVLSRQRGMEMFAGGIGGLLLINLLITFAIPGISVGGHLGGLAGGAAAAFVLSRFGRGHVAYSRFTMPIAAASGLLLAAAVVTALAASRGAL